MAMEFQRQSLCQLQGFISDISFDYYGKRFATASTKSITSWTLDSKTQAWESHDLQLPSGLANNITKLTWAHPEFGQLIASCSLDRSIGIWEEQDIIARTAGSEYINKADKWKLKSQVNDKHGIHDVKFAPRILGLMLGSACDDGCVRMYEPTDLFTLAFWEVKETIPIIDSEDDSQGLAAGERSTKSLNCMCWSDSIPPRFAIGALGRAVIFVKLDSKWTEECSLITDIRATDIAWAPSMGRTFQFIATASREPSFQIHTLRKNDANNLVLTESQPLTPRSNSPVWRVTWNATGTVLAASSENGSLSLWRRNFANDWIEIQTLLTTEDNFSSFVREV